MNTVINYTSTTIKDISVNSFIAVDRNESTKKIR